jgi:penicillin-binding protein 1A
MPNGLRPVRRRRLLAVVAALVVLVAGLFAAAWLASPTPTNLGAQVRARLPAGARQVSLDDVSPLLREAVVATEDERFYSHRGIDLIGVVRALPYDLSHLSTAQGASTITEQVAKLLYLGGDDHSPWRKLEDAALALKLEGRYTKEQILDAYLNSAYFGHGATGIAAASERYFGVAPARLSTAQASLLAGLPQAPSSYDPFTHPALARARQVVVLRSLVRTGELTETEAARALARPLQLAGGRALPPVVGVDLSPGPAFLWWQFALGTAIAIGGGAALLALRRLRLDGAAVLWAARACSAAALVVGAAVVVRSFRSL